MTGFGRWYEKRCLLTVETLSPPCQFPIRCAANRLHNGTHWELLLICPACGWTTTASERIEIARHPCPEPYPWWDERFMLSCFVRWIMPDRKRRQEFAMWYEHLSGDRMEPADLLGPFPMDPESLGLEA